VSEASTSKKHKEKKEKEKEKEKKKGAPPEASCDIAGMRMTTVASDVNGMTPKILGEMQREMDKSGDARRSGGGGERRRSADRSFGNKNNNNNNRFEVAMENVRASFRVGMVVGVGGKHGSLEEEGGLAFVVVLRRLPMSSVATVEGIANNAALLGVQVELPFCTSCFTTTGRRTTRRTELSGASCALKWGSA
jgi:hypothetical protein